MGDDLSDLWKPLSKSFLQGFLKPLVHDHARLGVGNKRWRRRFIKIEVVLLLAAWRGFQVFCGLAVLLTLLLMVIAAGFVAVELAPQSPWAYKWRYLIVARIRHDGLSGAVVTVDARPHNCEFMAAPLGSKNCHYKRNVATIRVRTSTAGRTGSFDEGRTWILGDGSTQPAVLVTWEKVED